MQITYTVSDGDLVLTLTPAEEGGYTVQSPLDPALITEAESIPEAFEAARDALRVLDESRADPKRWERARRKAARQSVKAK